MTGRAANRHQVREKLGEGGMSVVSKAEEKKLERTVALEFLAARLVGSIATVTRATFVLAVFIPAAAVVPAASQTSQATASEGVQILESAFYCPMDPDVRARVAGKCPKCGIALVVGIPDPVEYHVNFSVDPPAVEPGREVELQFEIVDPDSGKRATDFAIVHEKIFHLLMVSHDLEFFAHEHPLLTEEGLFRLKMTFPKAGSYRLLTDFYPEGATPQMIPLTLTTQGFERGLPAASLTADLTPQHGDNVTVSLRTDPPEPIAGIKTLLFFRLDTAEGMETFLGAWAHLLAVSDDLADLIHAHPTFAAGGPDIQVNMIFPRPGVYRISIQTQRRGTVNTVAFNLPVKRLGLTSVPLLRK